jgi:hypothetical protein
LFANSDLPGNYKTVHPIIVISYRGAFELYKSRLQDTTALYFPDYTLSWILRTDASEVGMGAVLLQQACAADGTSTQLQPIAFVNHKFSEQAQRWSTIEQEAFGIFYSVFKLNYYLIGKEFIIETDHNNLLWMEASRVPKVIRWRIYLQGFNFCIKHIPGKKNIVADWLSRLQNEDDTHELLNVIEAYNADLQPNDMKAFFELHQIIASGDDVNDNMHIAETTSFTPLQAFHEVHNGRVGHVGARLTWHRLNKFYPGHGLSLRVVADLISECPTCLKTRSTLEHALKPLIRHLKQPHERSALGIDALEITPPGKRGETHIIVYVNLFTKHTFLYPTTGCTALNLSYGVWHYWASFGTTDMIVSDQGPDLKSELFRILTSWMSVRHQFSIVDQHVNGVERTLKEVSKHARALLFDERISDVFGDPTILPAIQYILNSEVHSETGYSPFELMFGSTEKNYFHFPATEYSTPTAHNKHYTEFLTNLNANLKLLRTISKEYQAKLAEERISVTPLHLQNKYQPGDFVLFDMGPKPSPKLHYRYKGPYEVIQQTNNAVTCKHLVVGFIETFDVTSLIIFPTNYHTAYEAALRDYNQYEIDVIVGHKGDPAKRTSMQFQIKFKDNELKWVIWSKDLFDSIPYELYVSGIPALYQLRFTEKQLSTYRRDLNKKNIEIVKVGDIVYVELQYFGYEWFINLNLPDVYPLIYVVEAHMTHWYHKSSRRKISIYIPIFPNNYSYPIDNFNATSYFSCFELDNTKHVLVDNLFVQQYPQIL